ncbi:MAG: family transcriptional regulator [Ilumatobacteraceae bacterium]|nr:family transcriptional regulator [Ilumatobacteraceae bacterium]
MRVSKRITRDELAANANVSSRAVQRLENGGGSSITTLVRVVAALDATKWLSALTPPVEFNPFDVLAQSEREARGASRASRGRVRR